MAVVLGLINLVGGCLAQTGGWWEARTGIWAPPKETKDTLVFYKGECVSLSRLPLAFQRANIPMFAGKSVAGNVLFGKGFRVFPISTGNCFVCHPELDTVPKTDAIWAVLRGMWN